MNIRLNQYDIEEIILDKFYMRPHEGRLKWYISEVENNKPKYMTVEIETETEE